MFTVLSELEIWLDVQGNGTLNMTKQKKTVWLAEKKRQLFSEGVEGF
jgi:hypothetical protein